MSRILILETTPSGFTPYYSGAYTEFSIATGAGKLYQNSGLHEGFVVGMTTNPTKLSDELSTLDLASITFGSGVEIGTVDVRGSGDNYFNGITKAADTLDPSTTYHHALYAQLTGSAGVGGGIKTGIVGSGANSTDFANGNYSGIFTTDETVYNFSTTYNTGTQVGSGVHADKSLSIGLSVVDRTNVEIFSQQELLANPFISGIHIDILNSNGTTAQSGFQSGFKDVTFVFSEQDNEQVFGSYTRNFGVQTRTVSDNGFISTGKFFLYGNRIDISRIRVTDGTGQFLDENTINFKAPNTGLTNALPETNRQKISDANISGQIQFQVKLEDKESRPQTISVYGTSGDIDSLTLDSESLLRSFDLKFNPLNIYSFSLSQEDNIVANTDYHFKFVPEGFLGTGETWTVGPYRIQSSELATDNPIMPNVSDQALQHNIGIGTTSITESDNKALVVYAEGTTTASIAVAGTSVADKQGNVGIRTNDPGLQFDAANVDKANVAATETIIDGIDTVALAGSGHFVSGNANVIAGGQVASISGGNLNFIGGGTGINVDHSSFSSSIGGRNNDIFSGNFSIIGGGLSNLISGVASESHVDKVAIVGGESNKVISAPYSFIGAGNSNLISGTNSLYSTIIGGGSNKIKQSQFASILGGDNNTIEFANHSVSAGNYSKVKSGHAGAFVFSDSRTSLYESTGGNTLNLRFESGVFVDTDSGIYINGNPVMTGASDEDTDTLQTVTDRGATTTNAISIHNSAAGGNPRLSVGRETSQSIEIDVDDNTNTIVARQDTDSNQDHNFVLNRVFGGTGENDFQISKAGTPQLTIDTDGKVGIGTDAPDSILHLDSDGATVLTIEADNDNNDEGDEAAIHLLTDGGFRTAAIAGGNATYETSASGNFNALNLQSETIRFHTAPSQDFNLASEKMRLTSSGNLGIGTTNPQYNLEIYSGDRGLGVSSTGTAKLVLEGDINNVSDVGDMDASIEFLHDAGLFGYRISSHNYAGLNALNFADKKGDTYTDVLHLGTGGNVGIGTDDPETKLHVQFSGTNGLRLRSTDDDCYMYLSNSTANRNNIIYFGDNSSNFAGMIQYNHQYDYMAFRVDGGERVRISAAGDVGFGTQAPLSKLDVRGDISGSGNFIGTGNGNRLTTNGVPYLLSGDVAGGGGSDTLQDVTDNGNSTTQPITVDAITGTGDLSIIKTDPKIILYDDAAANTDPNGEIIFKEVAVTDGNFAIRYNGANDRLEFNSPQDLATGVLTVTRGFGNVVNQKVGVNTVDPKTNFHVVGSGNTQGGVVTVQNSNTSNGSYCGIQFINSTVNTPRSAIFAMRTGGPYDADLTFHTTTANELNSTDYSTGTERMRITHDGTVGIGTNSPGTNAHLEVYKDNPQIVLTDSNEGTNDKTFRFININESLRITARTDGNTANTAGGDIMTLERDGNVGIGTDNPGATLDLRGDMRLDSGGSTDRSIYFRNQATVGKVRSDAALQFDVGVSASPTLAMYIEEDTKNVGIGTVGPTGKLDVEGVIVSRGGTITGGAGELSRTDAAMVIKEDDTIYTQVNATNILRKLIGKTSAGVINIGDGGTSIISEMAFHAGSTVNTKYTFHSGSTEIVRIESDGKVGIGTDSPDSLLHLESASSPTLRLKDTTYNNILLAYAQDAESHVGTYSNHDLVLDANSSERIRITSAGNVGIGTNSPSNALDVVGHFSATSKSFLIDHPTKENKKLQYASLEGPENGVYVRGTTNSTIIELPDYWSELVHEDSITVVLTPIGKKQDLYIKSKSPENIMIGGVEGSYDYVVYGERKDIDKLEIEPLKV